MVCASKSGSKLALSKQYLTEHHFDGAPCAPHHNPRSQHHTPHALRPVSNFVDLRRYKEPHDYLIALPTQCRHAAATAPRRVVPPFAMSNFVESCISETTHPLVADNFLMAERFSIQSRKLKMPPVDARRVRASVGGGMVTVIRRQKQVMQRERTSVRPLSHSWHSTKFDTGDKTTSAGG